MRGRSNKPSHLKGEGHPAFPFFRVPSMIDSREVKVLFTT